MSAVPTPPIPPDRSLRPPLFEPPPQPPRRPAWQRALKWVGIGLLILIAVVVIAVFVALRSTTVHRYVLNVAEDKLQAALGTRMTVGNFALHFSGVSPTLDLYSISVYGAPPYSTPPLLQVDHIGVGVQVVSLFKREWYFNSISIDRPVARVFVDRRGVDNLPKPKSSGGQSHTSIFDLGVRHAVLDRGEVYYNNRKSVLSADLHQLAFHSTFDTSRRSYSGDMSYRDGHLQMGAFNPIGHDLQARFVATPSTFTLDRAVLTSGRSQFILNAKLTDYAQPHLQATYTAVLDTAEFRRIMKNPSLPVGELHLAGSMQYQSRPNVPMLKTVTLVGNLSSPDLRVSNPSFRSDLRDLRADYRVANDSLYVTNLRALVLGGQVSGAATMANISGATHSQLQIALRGASLQALTTASNSAQVKNLGLRGVANANLNAAWGKSLNTLVASVSANTKGSVRPAGANSAVPISGQIQARYAAATHRVALAPSYIRTPQTMVSLNGVLASGSALRVQFNSTNLHELQSLLPASATSRLTLYGQASFVGTVHQTAAGPQVAGVLAASNLKVNGGAWRSLRTGVSAGPSLASLQNGVLQAPTGGRIAFNFRAGLKRWKFSSTSPLQANVNATQIRLDNLERTAGKQLPASGIISMNVAVHGSELSPVGAGTLTLTKAKVEDQPLQSAILRFQANGTQVQGNLAVQLPSAGQAQAAFTVAPRQQTYSAQVRAVGIQLAQLAPVRARNIPVSGTVNLTASGQGTFHNPQFTATLQVPQLKVQNQNIQSLMLQANVANHVATVAMNSQVIDTAVSAHARVELVGQYNTTAAVDTTAIPLRTLVAMYKPAEAPDISGQTELHATLRGPLKNKSALDAHATIPILQVSYKNTVHLGAASPIHIDFANGVLSLQRTTIRGTDTELQAQATIPTSSTAPASMLLLGRINLGIAQLFDPDITSSGEVRLNINSYGARANPNIQGQVQIVNATFASGSVPVGLQDGNGVLTLTKDRLDITRFEGTVGGGKVTASGGVVYRPSLAFDLAMAGNGLRLLYPDGVREALDLNLTLTGSPDASTLGGQVRIDQLSFTPDFDLTTFLNQFSGESAPPPTAGFTQNMQLNVAVQSTGGVNLVSRTLSLQAAANLQLQGTAADPVILGRVNINGGDLIFMGNRYVLEGGTIEFVNPVRTQPVLNVSVNTTIQQYQIYMRFEGPVDQLHTNYSSVPALPPADIIHLLAFGSTTEAAAANPTPGSLGAESVVASQVTSQVTSRVAKIAGISQLSVDPVLRGNSGGSGSNPGARVTIQERVTGNLFVTFSTDVTTTQDQVIQLQYKVSPRVSFSGTRDQNGGFGFDTRIHKTW